MLLEDTDFEYLYSKDMDGLENDPAMQAALSLDVPPLSDWFDSVQLRPARTPLRANRTDRQPSA